MTKARLILGATMVALASGVAVFAAQQPHVRTAQQHQSTTHMSTFAGHHEGCTPADASSVTSGKSHLPAHVAQMLELTSSQQADIERLSEEACQAVVKAHDAMMKTLTPEQRAKIAELHDGNHASSGIHAFLKKLHGGGK